RLIEFLQQSTDSFVVTTSEHYARLATQLPADVAILGECAEFPRQGSVLVLGQKASLAQRNNGATK
ncbi:MAG TPA: hypothetical protein VFE46_02275, partial [Pirellulales bacterium]|nr:hypothetical protein [Pirellulales bacterium]